MRLVSLLDDGIRTGLVVGEEIVDLTDPVIGLPGDMVGLLSLGPDAADAMGRAPATAARRLAIASAHLLAPVPRPPSFLAIAQNYEAHSRELGRPPPEFQTWFAKQPTCVIGPGVGIEVPRVSTQVDYEGELGMVVGRRCRHVPADRAFEVVAGFMVVNDVSVRDWQWRTPTMMMGKGFDTHGPTGPWLVTPDELGDPQRLSVQTWVNDELRQDGNTGDMVFTCAQMIEHLSTAFTLEPGMILSTGTPAGVGASHDPPRWIGTGDTVRIAVEGIGELSNPVVDEPGSPADGRA
ncbi:MAG TPA: fumarylacetoacetate hydrolase family protein [Acidimicrobiales bacterium]|nr:fumarylacetoacetate hydrolase family protein [Acidimicrobiales bacterium]